MSRASIHFRPLAAFLLFLFFFIFSAKTVVLAVVLVDINSASPEELDAIAGIGPALAQKIIAARPFISVDDLIKVKGIGTTTLEKIKKQGLACVDCQLSTATTTAITTITSITAPIINYSTKIFINEILPSPEGTDEENEWIELLNGNDFEIDLSDWQIKDTIGSIKIYTFPKETKIPANGFLVLKRPETKIVLQNNGDGLELINPNKEVVDKISYGKAPQNQSFNKTAAGWLWSESLTPGKINIISQIDKISSSTKATASGTPLTEKASETRRLSQAQINESLPKSNNNSFLIFFIAFLIALGSGAAVWFLKKSQN